MAEDTRPTRDEILALPRWARVAFAARCAHRVQPLFLAAWPQATQKHLLAIEHAIHFAEHAVAASSFNAAPNNSAAAATNAANAATAYAFHAAAATAYTAAYAATAVYKSDAAYDAIHALNFAVDRFIVFRVRIRKVILTDFDTLSRLVKERNWTDDSCVSPEDFGPLWPEGPPQGWPELSQDVAEKPCEPAEMLRVPVKFRLALRAMIEDGTDPKDAENKLVELYRTLNDYCLTKYGKGLTVAQFKRFVAAGVPAGVGP